jgi:hypothetical protein
MQSAAPAVHVFPWRKQMKRAGFRRNAVYVVRPDGYVGLADRKARTTAVASYLNKRRIVLTQEFTGRHARSRHLSQ